MIPASRCKRQLTAPQVQTFLSGYLPPEHNIRRYAVRDILRDHFDDYLKDHSVPCYTQKVVRAMMKCGTGELGYSLFVCDECGSIRMTADRCGCRYCSACGYLRKIRWVEERRTEVIEGIPYFHMVFTLPHELNSLLFQNQKLLLRHLFHSVSRTVLELSSEKKKIVPGIIMVLHTFGSAMTLHYHIHMLVSGGGLSLDKKNFKVQKSKNFFLPVKAVRTRYRSLFMQGLKELHDSDSLEYFGDTLKYRNSYEWKELLNTCYEKDWNVEIRKYFSPSSGNTDAVGNFSGYANRNAVCAESVRTVQDDGSFDDPDVDNVIDYLSEYSSRCAITDSRIRSADGDKVSFEYKDYRSGGQKKTMTLSVTEFIRRFLLHILPKGMQKIRYGGFLAGCVKAKNLALIRKLLKQKSPENPTKGMTSSQLVKYLYRVDFSICRNCNAKLLSAGHRIKAERAAYIIINFHARAS